MAKVLLTTCDASLNEVAARCGFNSSGQLTRMFKRLMGVNPRRYRAKVRSD